MVKELSPWGKSAKKSMIENGISLESLCESVGYSKTYVSSIINGRVIVPQETIQKISKELGINADLSITK